MAEAIVFGANHPCRFAVHAGNVYTPAANGIVITQMDGSKSSFWEPTAGLYPIDNMAISAKGILCFTERRLRVSLHFHDTTTMQKLQEVPDVGRVAVQSLAFDGSGERLFIFSATPNCVVTVCTSSPYGGGFTVSHTVPVPGRFSNGVFPFRFLMPAVF